MKLPLIVLGIIFVVCSLVILQVNKTFDCSTLKQEDWHQVEHNNMTFAEDVSLCKQTADSGYTMSSILLYAGLGIIIVGFILGRKHKQQSESKVDSQ